MKTLLLSKGNVWSHYTVSPLTLCGIFTLLHSVLQSTDYLESMSYPVSKLIWILFPLCRSVYHFACSSCDQKMSAKTKFYEVDLKPVCKKCYNRWAWEVHLDLFLMKAGTHYIPSKGPFSCFLTSALTRKGHKSRQLWSMLSIRIIGFYRSCIAKQIFRDLTYFIDLKTS